MTERYEDVVGRGRITPYLENGAYLRDCPDCGARGDDDPNVAQRCMFWPEVPQPGGGIERQQRFRHHPCISRIVDRSPQ